MMHYNEIFRMAQSHGIAVDIQTEELSGTIIVIFWIKTGEARQTLLETDVLSAHRWMQGFDLGKRWEADDEGNH